MLALPDPVAIGNVLSTLAPTDLTVHFVAALPEGTVVVVGVPLVMRALSVTLT